MTGGAEQRVNATNECFSLAGHKQKETEPAKSQTQE